VIFRDARGQVFILHLATGKQKGAGGISNAECGKTGVRDWGLGIR